MTIGSFTYTPEHITVYFGNGRFNEISTIADEHGLTKILVLSTASDRAIALAERAGAQLGNRLAGYFTECVEQVPVENAAKVQALAKSLGVDGVLCVGGGSTIGHGKAVALEYKAKLIHVVTTYSGSEMTDAQGFVKDGVKEVLFDRRMRAAGVVYDPELTVSLPPSISGPSGMNAMAHCVEALYGQQGNPVRSVLATAGIKALGASLPGVVARPDDLDARGEAFFGAYMSSLSVMAGIGLHHATAHVLGGSFGIPHAFAHTLALPHTIAYNRDFAPDAMKHLAGALECEDGPQGLFDVSIKLGIDMALSKWGFDESKIDKAIDLLIGHPVPNPRPLERPAMVRMFEGMIEGKRPA